MRRLSKTYLLLLMLVLMCAGTLHATEVRVLPATSDVPAGTTVALTVSADQAADLGGFQFHFSYDPAILSVVTVSVNNAFDLPVRSLFSNATGTGLVAASVYSSPTLSAANPPLAVITFMVKAAGGANIGLTNVILGKVGGEEIPSAATGGAVNGTSSAVTISASAGQNGAILPSGLVPVNYGANQAFTITPNAGYHVTDILVDGVSVGAVANYTFANVTADHTISAGFAINTYAITATAGPNGVITPSGAVSTTYGSNASFAITPNQGYLLATLVVDGSLVDLVSPYTFINVTTNHTISATFSAAVPPAFTSISPGQNAVINTAVIGYTLDKNIVRGSAVFTRTGGAADTDHTYTFQAVDMTAGSHSINTGLALVDGAVYSITFIADDGIATGTSSVNNVTYDLAASVTILSPLSNTYSSAAAVSFTTSNALASGRIVFTRTGGTADAASPHTYTLSTAELTAGGHTVNTGIALVNGAIYRIDFANIVDQAGNPTAQVSSINVTYDTQSVAVTNILPALRSIITEAVVGYTLSEDSLSGTVTFTRTGGVADSGSPHAYTFLSGELTKGAHTVSTGLPLVDGAFYTVTFSFIDKAGNPAAAVSNALIFFGSDYGRGPVGNVDNTGSSENRVDNADVVRMRSAMNSRPWDPNWNLSCDLNRDNRIDERDMMILLMHYGESGN